MKKNPDKEFADKLCAIKSILPTNYMALLDYTYPKKFSKSRVYNVMNAGVEDKEILKALEKIAKKYEHSKV